jgi:hypothetical protein
MAAVMAVIENRLFTINPLREVVRQLRATYLLSPTHEVSLFTVVASIYAKVTRPLADIPTPLVPRYSLLNLAVAPFECDQF